MAGPARFLKERRCLLRGPQGRVPVSRAVCSREGGRASEAPRFQGGGRQAWPLSISAVKKWGRPAVAQPCRFGGMQCFGEQVEGEEVAWKKPGRDSGFQGRLYPTRPRGTLSGPGAGAPREQPRVLRGAPWTTPRSQALPSCPPVGPHRSQPLAGSSDAPLYTWPELLPGLPSTPTAPGQLVVQTLHKNSSEGPDLSKQGRFVPPPGGARWPGCVHRGRAGLARPQPTPQRGLPRGRAYTFIEEKWGVRQPGGEPLG